MCWVSWILNWCKNFIRVKASTKLTRISYMDWCWLDSLHLMCPMHLYLGHFIEVMAKLLALLSKCTTSWQRRGFLLSTNLTKHLKQFAAFFFSASEEVVVGGEVPVAASEEVVITNNVDLPIEGSPFCYSTVNLWSHEKSPNKKSPKSSKLKTCLRVVLTALRRH